MNTYDDAAFERFCAGLINEGFAPVPGTELREWTGPLRPSLRPLTDVTRMTVKFYDGWPLRYAHVSAEGLQTEHATRVICLWADDDPAQVAGRDLQMLWERLDEWAATAQRGFRIEDRALDAYLAFDDTNSYHAELPFGDLITRGNNGYRAHLTANLRGSSTLMIEPGAAEDADNGDTRRLKGAFYLRRRLDRLPRNLADIHTALTHRQARDLDRGLAERAPAGLAEPSGGYDFIVLAWPRHDEAHDAVVVAFEHGGDSLRASALAATPNDTDARRRRAGPDADLLVGKKALVAGAGSVGGHVAVGLACSGVGTVVLHDSDHLTSGNLVRHVCPDYAVGYRKTAGVSLVIGHHAPWARTEENDALPHDPVELAAQINGVDLVVDCTGVFSVSAALAEICRKTVIPLVIGALYHKGALARIQRQAQGDTPIAARPTDPAYLVLPPEDPVAPQIGFLELGCISPVNNASPVAVLSTAAEISHAAVDCLTGRRRWPDERIVVYQPLQPPFDRIGTFDGPRPEAGGMT